MKIYKLLIISVIPAFTACGTLDSVFPDRKKEYKETSTIPPLEIPPDLSSSSIEDVMPLPGEVASIRTYQANASGQTAVEAQAAAQPAYSVVLNNERGLKAIHLNDSFPSAWRRVGKALANLAIEVEDRNRSLGIYYIQYAEKKVAEEEGFFASMAFWRTEVIANEQPYQVKLSQEAEATMLQVLGKQGQPLSNGEGEKLLAELHKELKSL
jgi:uncharacterized lipoprotein